MTPHRPRLRRAVRGTAVAAVVAIVLADAGPAAAATWWPDFEAPFGCGQRWYAGTRSGHSPSYYSVDFNADDDWRAPVLMSAPGVVIDVVDLGNSSYGKYVVVDHGRNWTSLYAHLDAQWVVEGQWLDQGQFIGLVGSSGGSTGPHLHFEERRNRVDQHAKFHGVQLDYNSTITSRNCGDVPISGDWNGDRRTDVGVFRPTAEGGLFRLRRPTGKITEIRLGGPMDRPLTGDWNGDGQSDVGVWKRKERRFVLRHPGGKITSFRFGARWDQPIAGDWDGDGRTDVGVYRPRRSKVRLRDKAGEVTRYRFASPASVPVTGDWDGDGRGDVGAFNVRTSTWVLRSSRTGNIRRSDFGSAGTLPVPGDWNGDGTTSPGTWGPSTAVFAQQTGSDPKRIPFGHKRR